MGTKGQNEVYMYQFMLEFQTWGTVPTYHLQVYETEQYKLNHMNYSQCSNSTCTCTLWHQGHIDITHRFLIFQDLCKNMHIHEDWKPRIFFLPLSMKSKGTSLVLAQFHPNRTLLYTKKFINNIMCYMTNTQMKYLLLTCCLG